MSVADYHERFASIYDTVYKDRDIAGEVRFAIELLHLGNGSVVHPHVLDFGCGTGSHALAFAREGIRATGFDISEAMIAQAQTKQPEPGSTELSFSSGSFSEWCGRLNGQRLDGAVSFFNVFNCMESPEVILAHLRQIAKALAVGARFLVDLWNGAAVFVDEPRPDVRHWMVAGKPSCEIVRTTVPEVDRVNQRCTLRYRLLTLDRERGSFTEFESVHRLLFLTPVQYRHLFAEAGLTIVDEFPKGRPSTPITDHDWYVSYLLRRDD